MTAAGVVLTTGSAILFLAFFFLDLAGYQSPPHVGIIAFVVPRMLFVIGLLLMPFVLWRRRRRGRTAVWPTLEFSRHRVRRPAIAILVLTGVSIAILATPISKTVDYGGSRCCIAEVR